MIKLLYHNPLSIASCKSPLKRGGLSLRLTDDLFGRVNPSARMSITFPKRLQDNPAYLAFGKSDRELVYGEGVFVGYRYYEQLEVELEFYFGHRLSYTEFEYPDLFMSDEFSASANHIMRISVQVQNMSKLKGAEVVQIYVADPDSSLQRPKKELKAFKKLTLEPGEKQTVTLDLDKYALSYWSQEHAQWMTEVGEFTVIVAKSANPKDEIMRSRFNLPRTFYWSGL
ncbi:fibronectin type III-like domain-containing protein [Ilyonectria destructans]|nr:fibronectin type III-like domain-containing protein [Ilyonectria destructans]